MTNDRQTQHQKLDKITDVVTEIRIEQGKVGVHLDNAEKERTEMKKNIEKNAKMKRISNIWDGINTTVSVAIASWIASLRQ